MKKAKQILAMIGVVLLLSMYVSTLIFGLMKSPIARGLFNASIFATIVVPVLLYMYMLIYKYLKNRNQVDELRATLESKAQQSAAKDKSSDITSIVFDVGKVLVDFSWRELFQEEFHFDQEMSTKLANAMFLNPIWNEFDRGELSDEEVLEAFYAAAPELKQEISQIFDRLAETIHMRSYTMDWLQTLKTKGYKLYVLSNYPKYTFERTQEALAFSSLMDGCIWSYEWKVVKPEPKIYEILLEKYSINPKQAVFIDDRQENLDAAKTFGFKTILFTNYPDVKQKLKKLGV